MGDMLVLDNRHTGEQLRLRRMRERDGQDVLLIDGSLPPRSQGPPPHIHWLSLEEGTVLAGTLGARCGDREIRAGRGEQVAFPPGVVHSWWNAGDDRLELTGRATPAIDLDRFLQALFAVVNAAPAGRPSLFHLAHVLWRHRAAQVVVAPPLRVQRLLFPVVIGLGHLLGKYRGQDWPGCPDTCTGAPEIT